MKMSNGFYKNSTKKVTTISFTLLLTSIVFIVSIMVGCGTQDPCATLVCNNGGVCQNGSCLCPAGYEGNNCSTESRAKFLGNYVVHSTTFPSNGVSATLQPYNCEITAGTNANEIIITSLDDGTGFQQTTCLCAVTESEFEITANLFGSNTLWGNGNQFNINGSATTPKFQMYYRNTDSNNPNNYIGITAEFFPM